VLLGLAAGLLLASASPASAVQPYPLNFQTVDFNSGTLHGLVLSDGQLKLADNGLDQISYTDPFSSLAVLGHSVDGSGDYVSGTWTSQVYPMSFPFNELVSSWNSKTPPGTWIQSEVKPQLNNGHWAKWYILGRWAYNDFVDGDPGFHRTSVGGQGDADGFVSIDTFFTKDHPAVAYQLRLTIFRRVGLTDAQAQVRVSRYSAVASNLTNQQSTFPSQTDMQQGHPIDLEVTPFSQETHHGEYPEFDNGGEAWCSPTSTAMVVNYWTRVTGTQYAPTTNETSWVNPTFADPEVDHTARYVYDYHYQGAGNWPFNTAYAAERGLVSDVTQLHNLRGGAVHQGGHSARRLGRLGVEQARRRDQEHERTPDGDRRVHGQRGRDRLRPSLDGQRPRAARLQPQAVREGLDPGIGWHRLCRPPG